MPAERTRLLVMGERTWPTDWAEKVRGTGCEMCLNGTPDRHDYGIRIDMRQHTATYLQWAAPQRGYAIVQWVGRHVAEPTELSHEESVTYWLDVLRLGRAMEEYFGACKVNYQLLGNGLPHLHTHVSVRFLDDPWPGRPLAFSATRSLPKEEVERDGKALRSILEKR